MHLFRGSLYGNGRRSYAHTFFWLGEKPIQGSKNRITYPDKALAESKEGQVTVMYSVLDDGSVSNASVVSASPERYFEKEALNAIGQHKFAALDDKELGAGLPILSTFIFTIQRGNKRAGSSAVHHHPGRLLYPSQSLYPDQPEYSHGIICK